MRIIPWNRSLNKFTIKFYSFPNNFWNRSVSRKKTCQLSWNPPLHSEKRIATARSIFLKSPIKKIHSIDHKSSNFSLMYIQSDRALSCEQAEMAAWFTSNVYLIIDSSLTGGKTARAFLMEFSVVKPRSEPASFLSQCIKCVLYQSWRTQSGFEWNYEKKIPIAALFPRYRYCILSKRVDRSSSWVT